jgi:hypothetical protein
MIDSESDSESDCEKKRPWPMSGTDEWGGTPTVKENVMNNRYLNSFRNGGSKPSPSAI